MIHQQLKYLRFILADDALGWDPLENCHGCLCMTCPIKQPPEGAVYLESLHCRTSLFEVSIANDLGFELLEEVVFYPWCYWLLFTVMVTIYSNGILSTVLFTIHCNSNCLQ